MNEEFKWFPTQQERIDALHMLSFFEPDKKNLTDADFEEMFNEVHEEIKTHTEDEYRTDLQTLADSPVKKRAELATKTLHEKGWLTGEEMMADMQKMLSEM